MAVSGMSGVYRSANGIGVFTLLLLVGLECLLAFFEARDRRAERLALTGTALCFGLATLAFLEGVLFILPAAYLYLRKIRRIDRTVVILPAAVLTLLLSSYAAISMLVPTLGARWGIVPHRSGGSVQHLAERLGALGAFNADDLIGSTMGTNSIWLTSFLAATIPWGWRQWGRQGQMAILFFVPHLLVWLFVFRNPCGHGTYALPLWAILSAQGAQVIWSKLRPNARLQWLRWPLGLAGGAVVCLTGWHTYVLFLQDDVAPLMSNLVFYREHWMRVPCGVPRFTQLGQPAAGVYVRRQAGPEDLVLTDFGGSLELYYAGRMSNPLRLDDVVPELDQPARMQALSTRYLILRNGTELTGPTANMRPACIILAKEKPSLLIYDLWESAGVTEMVSAEELRPVFYSEYANWRELRPFLTGGGQGRVP